jgi:hypothetical protein
MAKVNLQGAEIEVQDGWKTYVMKSLLWFNELVLIVICFWESGFLAGLTGNHKLTTHYYITRQDPISTSIDGGFMWFASFGIKEIILSLISAIAYYLMAKVLFAMILKSLDCVNLRSN